MSERLTSDALWARALRVVLVFALVFWSSFQIEAIAFAAILVDNTTVHEAGTLSDLDIWEVDKVDTTRVAKLVRDVRDTVAEKPQTTKVDVVVDESTRFVAVPAWVNGQSSDEEMEKERQRLTEELNKLTGDLANLDTERQRLEGELAGVTGDLGNLETERQRLEGELGNLETERQRLGDELNNLQEGQENLEEERQRIEGELARLDVERQGLEGELGNLETERQRLEGERQRLEGELGNLETERQRLESERQRIEQLLSAYADKSDGDKTTESPTGTTTETDNAEAQPEEAQPPADVTVADFVEWKVSDKTIATLKTESSSVVLTGLKKGTVTVTCSLKPEAANLVVPTFAEQYPGKPFEVSFTVDVVEPDKPYVSSLVINKPKAGAGGNIYCIENEEITLSESERESYSLWVQANVYDKATDKTASYDCTAAHGLSELTGGKFSDLVWKALKADGTEASSDEITVKNGVITLKGDGPYTVRCISTEGPEGSEIATQVKVKAEGAKIDPQGEYNPQDTLTVEIDVPQVKKTDETSENGNQTGDSTKTDPNAADSGTDAVTTQAEDGTSNPTDSTGSTNGGTTGGGSNDSVDNPSSDKSGDAATKTLVSTSKTYDYKKGDLEPFTIKNADGKPDEYAMSSPDGLMKVQGSGPTLAALIYQTADPDGTLNLGVREGQTALDIESVEFVIAGGKSVTVPWSDLVSVSAPNNIILASQSRVVAYAGSDLETMAEGEPSSASSSAATNPSSGAVDPETPSSSVATDTGLLDNTRFRLLYNGSGAGELADPDSFRYINKVIVHVKGQKAEEPEPVDKSRPYVAYTPVKKGERANLVPQFTLPDPIKGGSVQFHYIWQWSTDKVEWKDIETAGDTDKDQGQQLEVLTNDSTIGTYRRFILHVTQIDGSTGEVAAEQDIESLPVKIEEGSGFRVKIDYVPPIAGDVANFTAIPQVDPDDEEKVELSQVYYEWQMSTDYGQTWIGEDDPAWPDLLKKQSGVQCTTLHIPTKPVSDKPKSDTDDSGSEGDSNSSATQLTWIRVVAHYSGKKTPSDPVPLTVHVGDTSGGTKADEIQEAIDQGTPEIIEPDEGQGNEETSQSSGQTSSVQISELDRIVFEDAASPSPTGTEPAPQSQPSQVYVNDAITEAVVEQEQAVKDEAASTTPGARWTELSSVNPTDDDVRNILSSNPFAPFAAPMALGITAAGVVEKLFAFRRQIK